MDDRHGPLPPQLIGLTVVAGLIDAASYLLLGHVFVANMTGNVVFLAFAVGGAQGFSIAASLLAVAAFCLGAVSGGRVASVTRHRGRTLFLGTLIEAGFMSVAVLIVAFSGTPGDDAARYALILFMGLAMGTQNGVVRSLAVPDLTTTVLTLTITGIAADSRLGGGTDSRIGRRLLSAAAMFVGALVGTVVVLHLPAWIGVALPLVGAVLVAGVASRYASSTGAWARPL